ncbi:hypothetical protein OG909_30190 [Streptomyces sp. NBC_01754]|uniref:hypothetical protein n=1 Tax=Streptomyces sp. NBC_01754 TaxID=2975930 RepID=UPI002DDC4676|nr:hypothetical protein [Streptomyces sp. NBC_01754]WSC96227.1 hypothetical protein OG909_30190 [Streptomyces sp. NBC_01754]
MSGFPAGGQLAVKLDDDAVLLKDLAIGDDGRVSGTVTVPTGTAPGDGRWLRFLAPQTSVRSENLTVTGDAPPPGPSPTTDPAPSPKPTESAPAAVPKVRLTDSGVTAGDKVTFTLSGFVRGQSVTAKLDDEEIIGQWPSTGADGSFTGTVTVPSDATKGAHRLRFLAPNPSTSLRADFTVTTGSASGSDGTTGSSGGNAAGSSGTPVPAASGAPASASTSRGATAEVTASQVEAGGQIHFKVTKFPAGQTVTVKFDDEEILGQWKADTAGAYEGDVTIPADTSAGAHWLRFLAPSPSTTLRVDITASVPGTAAVVSDNAQAAATTPLATDATTTAASAANSASYATIAWSAAAAAAGGAGGAGGAGATVLLTVRRRAGGPAAQA